MLQSNYNSNIKDHWSDHHDQYNNNEKVWNIERIILIIWKTWNEQILLEKWCQYTCLDAGLPYFSQLVKNTASVKHSKAKDNKTRYACKITMLYIRTYSLYNRKFSLFNQQSKCPWIHEWVKKMWYSYKIEFYSATRKKFFHLWQTIGPGRHYVWSKPDMEKWILYYLYVGSKKVKLTEPKATMVVTRGWRWGKWQLGDFQC